MSFHQPKDQKFDTFQQWVECASRWLTGHPQYHQGSGANNGPQAFQAICFDSKGRLCRVGAHFHRARDEDAFPVYWLWPDQVGEVVLGLLGHLNNTSATYFDQGDTEGWSSLHEMLDEEVIHPLCENKIDMGVYREIKVTADHERDIVINHDPVKEILPWT